MNPREIVMIAMGIGYQLQGHPIAVSRYGEIAPMMWTDAVLLPYVLVTASGISSASEVFNTMLASKNIKSIERIENG